MLYSPFTLKIWKTLTTTVRIPLLVLHAVNTIVWVWNNISMFILRWTVSLRCFLVAGCEFVRMNESSWVKWMVQTSHLLHRSLLKERYKRISSRYVNVNLQGRDTKRGAQSRLGQNGLARKLGEKQAWPSEKKLTEFYFLFWYSTSCVP